MHTPFDNPAPETYRDCIDHYARDLAWGVENELWSPKMKTHYRFFNKRALIPIEWEKNVLKNIETDKFDGNQFVRVDYLVNNFFVKWFKKERFPNVDQLEYWGYIHKSGTGTMGWQNFTLDHSAFNLLRQPYRSPRVFISYRHKNSSALALAIEARLRHLGNHDVFVDKSIPSGRKWEEVIEKNIIACDYFVLLVTDDVFESKFVKQEFDLAIAENKTIYPFCHHDVNPNDFHEFKEIQSITCEGLPSAKTFENAINELLFWMGYPTY